MFSKFSNKDLMDLLTKTESATLSGTTDDVIPDKVYDELVEEAKRRKLIHEPDYESPNGYFMGSIPKPDAIPPISGKIIVSPKYDGVSCLAAYMRTSNGMELKNANTRGVLSHGKVKCSDLTHIMKLLAPVIKVTNTAITKLVVRGEIVLTEAYVLSHPTMKSPAAIASGMLSRNAINEEEFRRDLVFRPYEVVECATNSKIVTIDQISAYNFLQTPYVTIETEILTQAQLSPIFNDFKKAIKEPIDGIVYSSADWVYPARKEKRTTTDYKKYAYKPSAVVCSTVASIAPTIDSEGRFKFLITYAPTLMPNGNVSTKCTITPTQLLNNKDTLGVNSIVTIGFRQGIYSYMNSVIPTPATIPYYNDNIKCPYCGYKLVLGTGSSANTRVFKCSNKNCRGMIGYKLGLIIKTYMHLSGVTSEFLSNKPLEQLTLGWILGNCRLKHDKKNISPSQAFDFMTTADLLGIFDCWWNSSQRISNTLLSAGIPLSEPALKYKQQLIQLVGSEGKKPENAGITPMDAVWDVFGWFTRAK